MWIAWRRVSERREAERRIAAARVRSGHVPLEIPTVRGGLTHAGDSVPDTLPEWFIQGKGEHAVVDEQPRIRVRYVDPHGRKAECTMQVDHLDLQKKILTGHGELPGDTRRIPAAPDHLGAHRGVGSALQHRHLGRCRARCAPAPRADLGSCLAHASTTGVCREADARFLMMRARPPSGRAPTHCPMTLPATAPHTPMMAQYLAPQGGPSRHPAVLPDGRFLRAVLRRRREGRAPARHHAHAARPVGRAAGGDVRACPSTRSTPTWRG